MLNTDSSLHVEPLSSIKRALINAIVVPVRPTPALQCTSNFSLSSASCCFFRNWQLSFVILYRASVDFWSGVSQSGHPVKCTCSTCSSWEAKTTTSVLVFMKFNSCFKATHFTCRLSPHAMASPIFSGKYVAQSRSVGENLDPIFLASVTIRVTRSYRTNRQKLNMVWSWGP